MKSFISQANNIWWVYNQQEAYNSNLIMWRLLILRYFKKRLLRYKINCHKYGDIKHQESEFIKDMDKALDNDNLKIKKFLTQHLIDTYKLMWKQANKNIDEDIPEPSEEHIEHTVKEVWVGNKNYEQRQDTNTGKISDKLKQIFTDDSLSLQQKQSEMEKALTSYYNMNHRLLRTETVHIIGRSNLDCLHVGGFYQVMWLTAEDEKVCPVCNSRDRHVYNIDLVPQYPDHPNCRCVLVAYKKHENVNNSVIEEDNTSDKIELNDKEIAAINKYISSDSYKINYKLRNSMDLDKEDINFITDLDKALDKLPKYNGNLCRAVELSVEEAIKFVNNHKKTDIIDYPAYTSTSNKDDYNEFANVMIYIENAKNGIDIRQFNPGESEILYKRNSKFKVNRVVEDPEENKYYILLEEKDE